MAVDAQRIDRPRARRPGSVVGIVVADFHAELTGAMAASAERELLAAGVEEDDVVVVHVPGSFELPIVARRLAASGEVDAVLCFGLVLRGETEHDRWVTQGCIQGLVAASLETDVPIHLGVLTCATLEQARARALPPEAGGREDKGREVARAAIETLLALDEIEEL
ncbi:MAG: 6,7-dimethyl-8-ribityllumazine synthase [Planctomycetes bacterium]|nr:6,7-dimethyl-8-ribityllumazine synthase [Planctomycetota bacterium]